MQEPYSSVQASKIHVIKSQYPYFSSYFSNHRSWLGDVGMRSFIDFISEWKEIIRISDMDPFYYPYFSARADLPPSLLQLDRQLAMHPPLRPDLVRLDQEARFEEGLQVRTHYARAQLERMRQERQIQAEIEAQVQLKKESEYLQRIAALRRERDLLEMVRYPDIGERPDFQQGKKQLTRQTYLTDEELLRHYTTGQKFNEYQKEVREKLAQQQFNNKYAGLPAKLTYTHQTENSPIKIEKHHSITPTTQQRQPGDFRQAETTQVGSVKHQNVNKNTHIISQSQQTPQQSKRQSARAGPQQAFQHSNSKQRRDKLTAEEAFKRSYVDQLQESKGHSINQVHTIEKAQKIRGQTLDLIPQIDTPFLQHRYGVSVSKNKSKKRPNQSISNLPKKKNTKDISQLQSASNRTFTAFTSTEAMKKINNRLKVSAIVYKDSKLRNQRHQLDHLFNTFQNEQKGRKEVKDRINSHPDILKKHNMVV